ncbi:protein FAM185A-like isoform X1 [Neodiprion virginianus]|uniref:protein FAM185A-like isoform X1 n=2 Tax=Neodiprion virginianus TaxID=2961670 RepID=UPI001EE6EF55|nr:protein FAM185A-like isoform X1 [Neodiprion virginianus]
MNTACGRFFLSYLRLNQKLYANIPAGSRCFGGSTEYENKRAVVLQEVAKNVNPFGKVVVEVPCDVEIRPTDFERYPDMNTLLVRVLVVEDSAVENRPSSLISVEVNDREVWEVKGDTPIPANAKCLIESPIRFDVDVRVAGMSSVNVSGMVSDSIIVRTAAGNITGEKLQASQMILSSDDGGSVTLRRTLQGNIEINTVDRGTVRADKFLGTDLKVSTENGDVDIGSSYCTNSYFTTENGNLTLNNLHMDSTIDIPGNGGLNILCLDGSLDAKLNTGPSRVRVVRLSANSSISSSGDVNLVVPEQNDIQLNLKAGRLDVDGSINGMEEHTRNVQRFKSFKGDTSLDVMSDKSIKVSKASWADTLNLGRFLR